MIYGCGGNVWSVHRTLFHMILQFVNHRMHLLFHITLSVLHLWVNAIISNSCYTHVHFHNQDIYSGWPRHPEMYHWHGIPMLSSTIYQTHRTCCTDTTRNIILCSRFGLIFMEAIYNHELFFFLSCIHVPLHCFNLNSNKSKNNTCCLALNDINKSYR